MENEITEMNNEIAKFAEMELAGVVRKLTGIRDGYISNPNSMSTYYCPKNFWQEAKAADERLADHNRRVAATAR